MDKAKVQFTIPVIGKGQYQMFYLFESFDQVYDFLVLNNSYNTILLSINFSISIFD